MAQENNPRKPRNRGAVYPVEILVRLTAEMGEDLDRLIERDKTQTKIGIVRKALARYIASEKRKNKSADDEQN